MRELPNLNQFNHIAILQTAFLGDTALTLFLASKLKYLNKNLKISFICTPQASQLIEICSDVDDVIIFDKRKFHKSLKAIKVFSEGLKEKNIDCIISPHRSLRSALVCYFSGIGYCIGFNTSAGSFLYDKVVKYKPHLHEIERNAEFLKCFSNTYPNSKKLQPVNFRYSEADINYIQELLLNNGISENDKFIIIAPGSVWETKRWLPDYFAELSKMLLESGYKVILIGSGGDINICGKIAQMSGSIDFSNKTSLPQTLVLLKKALLTITNDSSPTHFSLLVSTPVITIFGPSSPIFGFEPIGENDLIIQNEELKCRPCRIHGGKFCPLGTHDCMKSILPDYVFKKSLEIIKKK